MNNQQSIPHMRMILLKSTSQLLQVNASLVNSAKHMSLLASVMMWYVELIEVPVTCRIEHTLLELFNKIVTLNERIVVLCLIQLLCKLFNYSELLLESTNGR